MRNIIWNISALFSVSLALMYIYFIIIIIVVVIIIIIIIIIIVIINFCTPIRLTLFPWNKKLSSTILRVRNRKTNYHRTVRSLF